MFIIFKIIYIINFMNLLLDDIIFNPSWKFGLVTVLTNHYYIEVLKKKASKLDVIFINTHLIYLFLNIIQDIFYNLILE